MLASVWKHFSDPARGPFWSIFNKQIGQIGTPRVGRKQSVPGVWSLSTRSYIPRNPERLCVCRLILSVGHTPDSFPPKVVFCVPKSGRHMQDANEAYLGSDHSQLVRIYHEIRNVSVCVDLF